MIGHGPILFVTASAPLTNADEAFVQDELTAMLRQGRGLVVVPMRRRLAGPNEAARKAGLADCTEQRSLVDPSIVIGAIGTVFRSPLITVRVLGTILARSGGIRNLLANLASLPKALWLVRFARRTGAVHVHAYWLAHTSTAAWVVSRFTGIPWSGTGYRWDIDAENLFDAKIPSAAFIRCADELGRELLQAQVTRRDATTAIRMIRTGVAMPESPVWGEHPVEPLVVGCIGAFVEKKAQSLLVRAFRPFHDEWPAAKLHLFGGGPLESDVRAEVAVQRLGDSVEFHGTVPLSEIRAFLASRPVTVLPSILTPDQQQEGIPVTLVEAMAHGSPVVSTRSGAIPNLVTEGCGVLLDPGDVDSITRALAAIASDPAAADLRSRRAFARVHAEFAIDTTARELLDFIEQTVAA
ncbi:glycosyltransferase family 4 protein [soil metagenome]